LSFEVSKIFVLIESTCRPFRKAVWAQSWSFSFWFHIRSPLTSPLELLLESKNGLKDLIFSWFQVSSRDRSRNSLQVVNENWL
jgi:hypothetical protein